MVVRRFMAGLLPARIDQSYIFNDERERRIGHCPPSYRSANTRTAASATRMPSIAALTMPPA